MNSTNTIINPKNCNYGCNTRIYWNTSENAYFEVFSGNRHQCPNRSKSNTITTTITKPKNDFTTTAKPQYYKFTNKQHQQPKPKMSNSLELLQGSFQDVQKKYEVLSDIVSEANGKVHGSQSHIIVNNANTVSLIVYYEVPDGYRGAIKHKFNLFIQNLMVLQQPTKK